ncbi:hypothetical protein ST21_011 [Aeromonas phage ST21]|uniref:Uncharacterized protein n=1 Tax=Aeromonas phage ST21 TaxID=3065691 RepID=A0AA96J6S5_9CAUD|nr:hypothetical protein ST21_011 [Aeromonas phage ST21]
MGIVHRPTDFGYAADSLILEQALEFKHRAEQAHAALVALTDATSPMCLEAVSDYLGVSFSSIQDDIENLACSLDSRINEMQGV